MDNPSFNMFDVFVVLVLVSSGVFAFRRGLVREVMSLGSWVLASLFAFGFYPMAQPFFREHIRNEMLADASTALGLFALAIVILVPLGDYLSGLVKTPTLSSIDRSLGFVFGLIRGFVIMCLIYLGTTFIWPEAGDAQPRWLEGARTKTTLAYGVDLLKSLVPEDPQAALDEQLKKSRKAAEEAVENAQRLEDISTAVPVYKGNKAEAPSTYDDKAREKMDDLTNGDSGR